MNLGRLVFDEVICRITRIWLEDGAIWVEAESFDSGIYHLESGADFSIYAPDGSLIMHASSDATIFNKRTKIKDIPFLVRVPLVPEYAGRTDKYNK